MENSCKSPVFQQDENVDPNVIHCESESAEFQKGEATKKSPEMKANVEHLNPSLQVQSPPSKESHGRTDITLLMEGLRINEGENGASPLAENVFLKVGSYPSVDSDSNDMSMSSHHDIFYSFHSSDNDDSVLQSETARKIYGEAEAGETGNTSIVSQGSDSTVVSDATVEHICLEQSFSTDASAAEKLPTDYGLTCAVTSMKTEDTECNSEAEAAAKIVPPKQSTVCHADRSIVEENSKAENLNESFEILSGKDLDANIELDAQACTGKNFEVVESAEATIENATLGVEANNVSVESEKIPIITSESINLPDEFTCVRGISDVDKELETLQTADGAVLNSSYIIDDCQFVINFEENAHSSSPFILESANSSSSPLKLDVDTSSKLGISSFTNEEIAVPKNLNEYNIPALVVESPSLDKNSHSPLTSFLKAEDNPIAKELETPMKNSEGSKSAELLLESTFEFPASIDLSGSIGTTPSVPQKETNNQIEDLEALNFKFSAPVPVVKDTEVFKLQDSEEMNLEECNFKMPEEGQIDLTDIEPLEMDVEQFGSSASIEFPMQDEQLDQQADDELFRMPEPPFLSSADEGEFKVPKPVKCKSSKTVELHSPADANLEHAEFKVPEMKLSEIPEFNKMLEPGLSKFPLENDFGDNGFKDEEFQDAAQFFEDPSSFTFLESIHTSQSGPALPRSSLYVNFDPLHSGQQQSKKQVLQALSASAFTDRVKSPEISSNLGKSIRESIGLISFASPVVQDVFVEPSPQKIYTEEEFQQALKMRELALQETHLKQQREQELESNKKLKSLGQICSALRFTIEELVEIAKTLKTENVELTKSKDKLEGMHLVLEKDCTTATEDLQKVESTFSDLHSRYERCKALLQTYKENDAELRRRLEGAETQLTDQQALYGSLQKRMQEQLEQAGEETAGARRSGEAQVAVLGAQLKKAELKVSSLENDVRQQKTENKKLGVIIDELMEKVSKT